MNWVDLRLPTLAFLRRLLSVRSRQAEIARDALTDIQNKDGNPEAVADIALENIKYVEKKRDG
jgi:hypothetical protein